MTTPLKDTQEMKGKCLLLKELLEVVDNIKINHKELHKGHTEAMLEYMTTCELCNPPQKDEGEWEDRLKIIINEDINQMIRLGYLSIPERYRIGFHVFEMHRVNDLFREALSSQEERIRKIIKKLSHKDEYGVEVCFTDDVLTAIKL